VESEKIEKKPWAYTLCKLDDGAIVLSVLCGGAAMYELNIPLDPEATAKAIADEEFLGKYASDIRERPEQYAHRNIRM
jgi:hypothetical protein